MIIYKNKNINKNYNWNHPEIVQLSIDPTFPNNPDATYVELSHDCIILLRDEKNLNESKIVDGVMVFQKICRDPFEIEFQFTAREVYGSPNADATVYNANGALSNYIFPQDILQNFIQNIWLKNTIIYIKNSYLNGIGITQIVAKASPEITTIRGSANVEVKLLCKENYVSSGSYNQTLVVT